MSIFKSGFVQFISVLSLASTLSKVSFVPRGYYSDCNWTHILVVGYYIPVHHLVWMVHTTWLSPSTPLGLNGSWGTHRLDSRHIMLLQGLLKTIHPPHPLLLFFFPGENTGGWLVLDSKIACCHGDCTSCTLPHSAHCEEGVCSPSNPNSVEGVYAEAEEDDWEVYW